MVMVRLEPGDGRRAALATSLLNRALGLGLYRPEGLLRDAADPTALVQVAERADLAGVLVARLLVPDDAGYYARFGEEATGLFDSAVGSLEALATEPASRRRGVGSRLTAACLAWMARLGCRVAVTISWRSGSEDASAPPPMCS